MDILTYFLIALGLSFDSFAVSVSGGIADSKMKFWRATRIASSLAIFQGGLTLIGWLLGYELHSYIVHLDHWIAFILLSAIGLKMIYDQFFSSKEEAHLNLSKLLTLVGVSIATSIDALVVGVSFGITNEKILLASFIIAFITYLAAMIGMLIGKAAVSRIKSFANLLGGLILIAIGVKILIEHTAL